MKVVWNQNLPKVTNLPILRGIHGLLFDTFQLQHGDDTVPGERPHLHFVSQISPWITSEHLACGVPSPTNFEISHYVMWLMSQNPICDSDKKYSYNLVFGQPEYPLGFFRPTMSQERNCRKWEVDLCLEDLERRSTSSPRKMFCTFGSWTRRWTWTSLSARCQTK